MYKAQCARGKGNGMDRISFIHSVSFLTCVISLSCRFPHRKLRRRTGGSRATHKWTKSPSLETSPSPLFSYQLYFLCISQKHPNHKRTLRTLTHSNKNQTRWKGNQSMKPWVFDSPQQPLHVGNKFEAKK